MSLCWFCKNAYGNCAWSRRFQPVKGWAAQKSRLYGNDSYKVTDCPQFDVEFVELSRTDVFKLLNINATVFRKSAAKQRRRAETR